MRYSIIATLLFVAHAHGHAKVGPTIRQPGNASTAVCGEASTARLIADDTGHIEEQQPVTDGCPLELCRGMQFADQSADSVQSVVAGQAMAFDVDCTIPHGGPANVSLVDTTVGGNGAIIGSFLATFDDFCPTSGAIPDDQTNLQFNLPDAATIGDKCSAAGDCVVQLFWATPDLSQNYYYCTDVKVEADGAAASSAPVSAAAVSTVAAPAVESSVVSSSVVSAAAAAITRAALVAADSSDACPAPVTVTVTAGATATPVARAFHANAAKRMQVVRRRGL